MKNTLEVMWRKYNLLFSFKCEMNKKGYSAKVLCSIHAQMDILMELIEVESKNTLEILLKKTYFRLLKQIDKGIEYLPDIVNNSENWILNKIEDDPNAWIDSDVLIFTTKSNIVTFSKLTRNVSGSQYIDGKWQ